MKLSLRDLSMPKGNLVSFILVEAGRLFVKLSCHGHSGGTSIQICPAALEDHITGLLEHQDSI